MAVTSDIFLSYNREDQAVARRFAESFERAGFTVWWDVTLRSGETYDQVTEHALRSAKAVVVLWSPRSVKSEWVRSEASIALRNRTLVPTMIEMCERPVMFELKQTADLTQWKGDEQATVWQALINDLQRFVASEPATPGSGPHISPGQPSVATRARATQPGAQPMAAAAASPSIAVLPFANLSGDKEQEYFSDGLAEEIINALAQLPRLKVIARTSAFAFKGQNIDIRRIAETLGVSHVLEGSVRRAGNRIRVTAQLITAKDGSHLWSERFDRDMADVFAVQDEISGAIAHALKVRLVAANETKARYTPSLDAWEALLKARHLHWKVTAESMEQARNFYEQAIALDPQFAQAYTEYADYLYGRTTIALSALRDIVHQSVAMANKALALDPTLSEPYTTLCYAAALHDHDWAEAHRLYKLASTGTVLSSIAWLGLGWNYHLSAGRREVAVECLQKAVLTDPLQQTCRAVLGRCLTAAGRYDEAETLLLQSLALEPDFFWTHCYLGELEVTRGRIAEALPYAEQTVALAPWYAQGVGMLSGILVRLGRPEQARVVMQKLGREQTYGVPLGHAVFHTISNELDIAAEWFAKAIDQRDSHVLACLQGGIGEPIRKSQHWSGLLQMAKLAPNLQSARVEET